MRRLIAVLFAVGALVAAGAQSAGAGKVPPGGDSNCSTGVFKTYGSPGSTNTVHFCKNAP